MMDPNDGSHRKLPMRLGTVGIHRGTHERSIVYMLPTITTATSTLLVVGHVMFEQRPMPLF